MTPERQPATELNPSGPPLGLLDTPAAPEPLVRFLENRARIASQLNEAIGYAAQARLRSAALLIEVKPSFPTASQAEWLAGIAQRIAQQPHESAPLPWDDSTLALCCSGFERTQEVLERARRIVQALTGAVSFGSYPSGMHCKIGIGVFPEDGDCAQALLAAAADALADLRAMGGDTAGLCLRRRCVGLPPAG